MERKATITESIEQCWRDELIEQRRCQHATKDDQRQRIENFLSRLACTQNERQQSNEAGRIVLSADRMDLLIIFCFSKIRGHALQQSPLFAHN